MTSEQAPIEHTIIYLPAESLEWAGLLTQFTLYVAASEGRLYATWASERMLRATETGNGVVALATDGTLLGIMIFEIMETTAELSFPWVRNHDVQLAHELTEAALQVLHENFPTVRSMRVERQLLPGNLNEQGVEFAGFECHWRKRMMLDMPSWHGSLSVPPTYRLESWNIRYLDMAAEVIYRANLGTLDARLYSPFFGDSPAQCRKGLLSILSGRYGMVIQEATIVALHDTTLVGINLVIDEGNHLASVVELSVDPEHQRHGVARALLSQSLTVLHTLDIERVELAVTNANHRAFALYESLGFVEFGTFPVCIWPQE